MKAQACSVCKENMKGMSYNYYINGAAEKASVCTENC